MEIAESLPNLFFCRKKTANAIIIQKLRTSSSNDKLMMHIYDNHSALHPHQVVFVFVLIDLLTRLNNRAENITTSWTK